MKDLEAFIPTATRPILEGLDRVCDAVRTDKAASTRFMDISYHVSKQLIRLAAAEAAAGRAAAEQGTTTPASPSTEDASVSAVATPPFTQNPFDGLDQSAPISSSGLLSAAVSSATGSNASPDSAAPLSAVPSSKEVRHVPAGKDPAQILAQRAAAQLEVERVQEYDSQVRTPLIAVPAELVAQFELAVANAPDDEIRDLVQSTLIRLKAGLDPA
jgi:hypothetical protein